MENAHLIRRAPKAFAAFARKHNALVRTVRPIINLQAGVGLVLTKAEANAVISLRQS